MQKLQPILDTYRLKYNIPAMSMTVSIGNNTLLNFYSGTIAKNNTIDIKENSLFRIGSITKSFTAAIILQLEAEGKLDINTDTVGAWLPQYSAPAWSNITIKQLLNMTAGTHEYIYEPSYIKTLLTDPTHFWQTSEVIANFSYPKTDFTPAGSSYSYSNTNYLLAGLILEKASGKTYQQNLEDRIFRPLHLNNTHFLPYLIPAKHPNMVHGYCEDARCPYEDVSGINNFPSPSGGIISTSEDIAKWIQMLFTGKVLPPKQFQEMTSLVCMNSTQCELGQDLPAETKYTGFGLGLIRCWLPEYGLVWYYTGATIGYVASFYFVKDKNFILSVSGNTFNLKREDFAYEHLFMEVYNHFYQKKL